MDIERALETQRLRLLRILAGLSLLVAFVARAPAVSMMPYWVRSYVAALLPRLEGGACNLVIVAACILSKCRVDVSSAHALLRDDRAGFKESSNDQLLRGLERLRAILSDLPRAAQHLLRRLSRLKAKALPKARPLIFDTRTSFASIVPARIERPPDKWRGLE